MILRCQQASSYLVERDVTRTSDPLAFGRGSLEEHDQVDKSGGDDVSCEQGRSISRTAQTGRVI
jgi:hypothetical protein